MSITLSFAYTREKAQDIIYGKGLAVYLHLIKVLRWVDQQNLSKHLDDINVWVAEISHVCMKPNPKFPTERNYYDWMFSNCDSQKEIDISIRSLRPAYGKLPDRLTNEQVYATLRTLYRQLAKDLSRRTFQGIERYLTTVDLEVVMTDKQYAFEELENCQPLDLETVQKHEEYFHTETLPKLKEMHIAHDLSIQKGTRYYRHTK